MTEYLVTWKINLDADSPLEAAEQALEIQRDRFSDALCFEVEVASAGKVVRIDLAEAKGTA